MADTSIEWTHRKGTKGVTWNPTTGCDRISAGCDHCYALTLAKRLKGMGQAKYQNDGDPRTSGPGFGITTHPDTLGDPLKWRSPRTVFVNSMSDLFHARVPREFVTRVWDVMSRTPQHTYQILTKRPERMARIVGAFPGGLWQLPLGNVWLGTSIESDEHVGRADHLRSTPAAVRFLSLEPQLEPLPSLDLTGIDWVITGGESGPGARPAHPNWFREIRDKCQAAGVAYFHKQNGAWIEDNRGTAPHLLHVNGFLVDRKDGTTDNPYGHGSGLAQDLVDRGHLGWVRVRRVGKHAAGRELDGRTWDEYPTVAEAVTG